MGRISVGDDYSITGYKISTTNGWGTTVVTENDQSEVFSGAAEMTVADLSTNSTWFTTADANLNGPVIDVYLVDALPTGILQTSINATNNVSIYSLDGRRLTSQPKHGVYILGSKKLVK